MSLSDLARATKTPSRRRLVLILAFLAAFGPLATDMYLPALPELAADLSCGDAAAQLTISVFLAGVALSQLLYGPVSDAIGRRRPLLFGTALFAVASAVCALAPDVGTLTAGRLLMALGGAAGMVLSRAVVRDLFSGREVAEVFSLLMVIMGAAPILAPLLGGQILLFANWRVIFASLVVAGAAACLAVWRGLPEPLPASRRRRHGVRLALAGYARLLRNRVFLGNSLAMAFNSGAFFTYLTCSPHVFIKLNGVSGQAYAALFGVNALGMVAASALNRRLLKRHAPARLLRASLALVLLAGLLLAACAWSGAGGLWLMTLLLFLTLASGGLVGPNATTLAMAPCKRAAGSASALLGTLQFGMGGLAGAAAGRLGEGTALPMCAMFAVCAALALASFLWAGGGKAEP